MDDVLLNLKLDRIEKLLLSKKRVFTFEEGCEYTGIKPSYMYKLTASKLIPHSKPTGKVIFFDKEKLDNWLLSNHNNSKAEIESKALSYSLKNKR